MKPKLLYLLHSYFNKGGTEEHTRDLSSGLKDDFTVRIMAPHQNHIEVIENNVVIEKIRSPLPSWPVTPLNWSTAENAFDKVMQEFNPDIIHIQHFYNWPLSILEKVTTTKKPAFISLHDYYLISPYFTLEGQAILANRSRNESIKIFGADITPYLQKRIEYFKELLGDFKSIITPSAYTAREHSKTYQNEFKIIEHGIQPFQANPKADNSKNFNFGFVGSLLPQKGIYFLLEAFAALAETRPDIRLRLFGSAERLDIKDLASQKQVIYHGPYDKSELPEICSQIDVAIIPSIFRETFNYVLSEMWMGKVPTAVADIGALSERIRDFENGRKFSAANTQALKETMQWFLENQEWKSWQIPNPRTINEMIEDYRKLYLEVI